MEGSDSNREVPSIGLPDNPVRRHLVRIAAWCTWTYLSLLLAVWLLLHLGGDRWWLPTVMLFGPRWILALPLVALIPAVFFRRRLVWPLLIAGLILLGPVMGFCIPWARLVPARGAVIRVLTCNTAGDALRNEALVALVSKVKPDIVALQECGGKAPGDWPAGWHVQRDGQLLVASRYRIHRGRVTLGRHSPHNRPHATLLHCVVETPDGELDFCAVHLPSPRYGLAALLDRQTMLNPSRNGRLKSEITHRRRQSEKVQQYVGSLCRPVILAGDFNMPVGSSIYRQVWARYSNAFSVSGFGFGYTMWPSTQGAQFVRIDHILTSAGLRPQRCWIGPDVGSDHLPLIADLSVSATPVPGNEASRAE